MKELLDVEESLKILAVTSKTAAEPGLNEPVRI